VIFVTTCVKKGITEWNNWHSMASWKNSCLETTVKYTV